MKSHFDLLMPILRGRGHLDRRLAGLLPRHTAFILLDVSRPDLTEEENVTRLRDAAAGAPRHTQHVMPVGQNHSVVLLAAVPTMARRTIEYAAVLAGDRNYVISENGLTRDRHGVLIAETKLDADTLGLWAEHLGVRLRADGLYERTPSFIAYARWRDGLAGV